MYNKDHKHINPPCLNPSEYKDLLEATIDSSLDIIQLFKAVRNEEGRIIDFVWLFNNKKAIEQNGDVIGRSLLQQHPGVIKAGIFEKMVKVTETGKPSEEEVFYNYAQFDGWFYQALVRSGDGVVLTTRDITKQKNAEAEIMKSRDLLLAMMDVPNVGIGVFKVVRNDHGEIIDFVFDFVNKRTLAAFGGNDPTGNLLTSYGSDGIEQLQYFKEVIETGNNNSYTRKAESGIVEGWFLFSNAPIGNDRLIQVWEDITELKQAEQEIKATRDRKQQEQRQQFLLNFGDTLRTIADPVETQRAAMRMFGEHLKVSRAFYYSMAQENGNWISIIEDDWHADPNQPTLSGRFPSTAFGAHVFTRLPLGEVYICPDSYQLEITPAELQHYLDLQIIGWIAYPIIRQGNYEGGVCIHSPVARNWTEEEITLTGEVAERTWEAVERANAEEALRKSEIRLKELLQIREDFIGVASHELKTPVTSIKVYAEVVQEKLEEREWVEERELMKRLNAQIDRLNELINDLLNTTKISAGKLNFCFGPTDLNEVIQERFEDVKRTTKHTFVLELGELPVVTCDQERIGQVITNLLTNAIKYSPITTTVTIKSTLAGDSVQVSVHDMGYGISPDDQLKIFDRFYRVTENSMDTFPGMGLGLYISAQIIERHGGTLTVESKPGKGSVFTFTIPLNQKQLTETA